MDRLSSLEAEFLHVEDGITHMHIGAVSVFAGPPPTYDEAIEGLATRLHRVPRYRQRVRRVPLDLGRPVWLDDPHFNIAYHVRHTALPAPGDDADLTRLVGRVMSQPLDRDRPLWEMWVIDGLSDGRWGILWKVHHCMVDGVAGVGLLTAVLDVEPDAPAPEPVPWTPAPEPPDAAKVLGAWGDAAGDLWSAARRTPAWARDPVGHARRLADTGVGLARLGRHMTPTPPLSIAGTIGPHRVWAHAETDLDPVKRAAKNLGGKVNDIVLTAVARGYRDLLEAHGDDVERAVVRTMVPVSLRAANGAVTADNQVSAVYLELPVAIDDARERFDVVHRAMDGLKASHMVEASASLTDSLALVPPVLVSTATGLVMRALRSAPQRSVTTVATNVPGPQFPVYFLGREMTAYLPYVPIAEGTRVGTAIISYNGRLAFGVTGDYDTAGDVDVLAHGIVAGIDELTAHA